MCKSMKFRIFSAFLFLLSFICSQADAQANIEPPEIKAALQAIIHDAKDSLMSYKNDPGHAVFIARAKMMDSLATISMEGERLVQLFRTFNEAFQKLPPAYRPTFKSEIRKKWLYFQVNNAISGGKWRPLIIDGVTVPPMFPNKKQAGESNITLKRDLVTVIETKRRSLESKPLEIILSFPTNGAYNVFRNEWNGAVWGYIYLNKPVGADRPKSESVLAAKWTSNKGDVTYTFAENDYYTNRVNFLFPNNFLKPALLYQLELVWINDLSGLKPYWDASCHGGSTFFNLDPTAILVEWAGVSAPMPFSIYFRVSTYVSSFKKIEHHTGKFDPATYAYSMELKEPMDSLELYGNAVVPPRMAVTDNFRSDAYENIFKSVVANYFVVPRTGKPVDIENVQNPHPFEQAGLYNQPFVYKMDEGRNTALASISRENVTNLTNGYSIPGVSQSKLTFKVKGALAPRITQLHFKGSVVLPKVSPITIEIESPKLAQMEQQYQAVRQLLQQRVKDRALFFYNMELRHCKQNKTECKRTLADFEKAEQDNLPPTIKSILERKFSVSQIEQGGALFYVEYFFPGANLCGSQAINYKL